MSDRPALFAIPSLRCGGAERVFTVVVNGLVRRGLDVHLAVCQKEGHWLSNLSSDVTVHDLKSPRVRNAVWPFIRLVRRLRPQTVLSTSAHFNVLNGLARSLYPAGTRVVLREVNVHDFEPAAMRTLRSMVMRRAYRSADEIICLGDTMGELIGRAFEIPRERLVRIFNPLDSEQPAATLATRSTMSNGPRKLLAVGTLEPRKGFDRILDAMPSLLNQFPGSQLTILGEGIERPALEQQIQRLGLLRSVRLAGFSSEVRRHLREADLFVLASRFEGLPNVLLEAIEERCPFVVVDHPGVTREVLELVGETGRITTQLDEWKPDWFEPIPEAAHQAAQRHFGLDEVLDQYARVVFPDRRMARRAA